MDIPALYECVNCKFQFSEPKVSLRNPGCGRCQSKYVTWLNYYEYVEQWLSGNELKDWQEYSKMMKQRELEEAKNVPTETSSK